MDSKRHRREISDLHIEIKIDLSISCIDCLGSVASPVIQATGRMDFEDGSRTATTLEVSNGLHCVCTSPEVNMAGPN